MQNSYLHNCYYSCQVSDGKQQGYLCVSIIYMSEKSQSWALLCTMYMCMEKYMGKKSHLRYDLVAIQYRKK